MVGTSDELALGDAALARDADSRQRCARGASSPAWRALALAAFVLAAELAGVIGLPFTDTGTGSWYDGLDKPSFTPPGWVFGPVWTALYALIGIAAWLVWRRPLSPPRSQALWLWWAQLAVNAAWTPVFFGAESPGWGLAVIAVLLALVIATVGRAWRVDRLAAVLLLPYLGWVGFATVLNTAIVAGN
jgi:tryptophan-rich sensory protein